MRTPSPTRTLYPALIAACLAAPLAPFAQPGPSAPAARATGTTALPSLGRSFNGINEDHILEEIHAARIIGRRQVGSTSVNFHLRLNSDIDAAFKPRSQTHGDSYRAEIAAFRVNRLLGINRVPPAISRYIHRTQLNLAVDARVVLERDFHVRGAAVYWVPILRDSRIDTDRERARWSTWLSQRGSVPPDQAIRAEEISTLIAFDLLIGNWDRWSGSNVPMDEAGHLVYRDNNGAFGEPFGDAMLQGVMRHLRLVQRFSRGVIERARGLTEESVRAEMALDPDTQHPPLSAVQIASMLRRRDALMAYVDDLVRRYGEANVLAFP